MNFPVQGNQSPHGEIRWIEAFNAGSHEIPAHGVVEMEDAQESNHRLILNVKRPTDQGLSNIAFNGHQPIIPGEKGWVTLEPAYALYNGSIATPSPGQNWGSEKDSFLLIPHRNGTKVIGDADTTLQIALVERHSIAQYGVMQENWVSATPVAYGCVKRCDDAAGSNPGGNMVRVFFPVVSGGLPNVVAGDIVGFDEGPNPKGTDRFSNPILQFHCVSPYIDDPVGTQKLWASSNSLRPGWAVDADMVDKFPYGSSSDFTTEGGNLTHTHTLGSATTGITIGNHSGITTNSGFAVIADHPDHAHKITLTTTQVGEDVAGSPVSAVLDQPFPVCTDDDVWDEGCSNTITLDHTDSGHTHTVPTLTHVVTDPGHTHSLTSANHLPPFKRRIFIIRVDNSVSPASAMC